MDTKRIIGIIARIIVGLVFIASAVTKYLSIDAFDIFVYEHQLMPWAETTFVTRCLISLECIVGILLLVGIYPKRVKILTILMLVGFTVYIILKPGLFDVDNENCHCFGTVLILSDKQTMIKNIILFCLSLLMFWDKGITGFKISGIQAAEGNIKDNENTVKIDEIPKRDTDSRDEVSNSVNDFLYKNKRIITIIVSIVILVSSFCIFTPDVITYKLNGKGISIDNGKFNDLLKDDSLVNLNVSQGKKIVCMYSTGCKYCKKAARRLDVVRQRCDIADSSFALVFWGKNIQVDSFFIKTGTKVLPHTLVHPISFLSATKGKQPVIILLDNGKVEKLIRYPYIDEKDINSFLKEGKQK